MPAFRTALVSTSVAAISVLCLALAGCSAAASGSGSGATAAGTSAATSSANPAAGSSQGTLDGVPATCPPAAEVMSNLHLSQLVADGTDPSLCEYLFKGSKTAPYAVITFSDAPGFTIGTFAAELKHQQTHVEAVSGLAEAAFTFTGTAGGTGLSFLSGGTICSILSTVPTTTTAKIALARAILAG